MGTTGIDRLAFDPGEHGPHRGKVEGGQGRFNRISSAVKTGTQWRMKIFTISIRSTQYPPPPQSPPSNCLPLLAGVTGILGGGGVVVWVGDLMICTISDLIYPDQMKGAALLNSSVRRRPTKTRGRRIAP